MEAICSFKLISTCSPRMSIILGRADDDLLTVDSTLCEAAAEDVIEGIAKRIKIEGNQGKA